jgi:general secretion pathway protein G
VIAVVLVLAAIVLPRWGIDTADARSRGCEANRRDLEVQARLWYRTKGAWPAADLSDMGANASFLPEGIPVCPVDGSAYALDATTHKISGHTHWWMMPQVICLQRVMAELEVILNSWEFAKEFDLQAMIFSCGPFFGGKPPSKNQRRNHMTCQRNHSISRSGFSLLELLAVVTILGIIAVVVIPRISVSSWRAETSANDQNKSEINSAVDRWHLDNGTWPASDLSDIGADVNYFPNGLPTNPVDGSAYSLDATTHRVN